MAQGDSHIGGGPGQEEIEEEWSDAGASDYQSGSYVNSDGSGGSEGSDNELHPTEELEAEDVDGKRFLLGRAKAQCRRARAQCRRRRRGSSGPAAWP